jgi:hypothetical protein
MSIKVDETLDHVSKSIRIGRVAGFGPCIIWREIIYALRNSCESTIFNCRGRLGLE